MAIVSRLIILSKILFLLILLFSKTSWGNSLKYDNLLCMYNVGDDTYFFIIDFEDTVTTVIEGDTTSSYIKEEKYVSAYNIDYVFIAKDRTKISLMFNSFKIDRKTLVVEKYDEGTWNSRPIYHKCEGGHIKTKQNTFKKLGVDSWASFIKKFREFAIKKKYKKNKL